MTGFLIRDNEAEAKRRCFVASLGNVQIHVESQLRKSSNIFLFSSVKGMLEGLNLWGGDV